LRARLEPAWAALRAGQAGQQAADAGSTTATRHGLRLSRILLSTALLSFNFLSSEAPVAAPAERVLERAAQPMAAEQRAGAARDTASSALAELSGGGVPALTRERAASADTARSLLERSMRPIGERRGEAERPSLPTKASPFAQRRLTPGDGIAHATRPALTETVDEPPASARQLRATSASETSLATTGVPASSAQERSKSDQLHPTRALQAAARNPPQVPAPTATGPSTSEAPDVRAKAFVPEAIDDELSWLGAAQEALRQHEPTRALQLVQEHAFRFPRGALAQERRAVQVLALCALQRKQAARSVLHELEQRAPSSPLVAGIRRNCGL
jgi:hypothetical protein